MGKGENRLLKIIVSGFVSTGIGKGREFVSLPWFRKHVKEKLGFEPYPGTLNLVLSNDIAEKISEIFDMKSGFIVSPEDGYFPGRLYKALIEHKIFGGIVRPEVHLYPKTTLEVIAPVYLRKVLNLKDGDEVEVEVLL